MPDETQAAVTWALVQDGVIVEGQIDPHSLVEAVRQYFNDHSVSYATFAYADIEAYLPEDIEAYLPE